MLSPEQVADRFWSKVQKGDGCWEWQRYVATTGYGSVRFNGRATQAHRVAYILTHGSIPEGMVIDHLCMNYLCVRPDHLEAVTQGENVRRWAKTVVKCPKGHEYTNENTYRDPSGGRRCRECHRMEARS